MKSQYLKKFLLYSIAFILYALTAATYIHALSLFLDNLGAEFLPYQFIVVSVLIIFNSLLSAFFSMRLTSNKIFSGALLFFIVNYILLSFMPAGSSMHTFYFMVIANLMFFLEEVTIMHFLTSLMTPLQAKSILPTIFSFTNLGVIVASFFAVPYSKLHASLGIGSIPIVVLLFMIVIVFFVSKIFRKEIAFNFSHVEKKPLVHSIKTGFSYVFNESRLYKWLAVVIFLAVGFHLLIEFKLKTVLSHTYSHYQLTEIIGYVFVINRIVVWIFSAFLSKRILFRIGVSNTLILYPAFVLFAVLIAAIFQLHVVAVVFLFIVFSTFHYSNFGILTTQILSIVPKDVHQSVYFLLKGLVYAFALLFFSLSLLLYSFDLSLETTVNTVLIAFVAGLFISTTLKVKRLFYKHLKGNLHKEDLYLKLRSIDLLAEKNTIKRGENHLRQLLTLSNTERPVRTRVMASLGVIGNYQTIVDLARILKSDESLKTKHEAIHSINEIIKSKDRLNSYPVTKHFLLQVYEEILLSEVPHSLKSEIISGLKYFDLEDVIKFLEDHLYSENANIVQNTIKTFAEFNDRGIIPYLEPFLDSDNPSIESEAVVSLWQFDEMRVKLLPKLTLMLHNKRKKFVLNSLYVIGSINAKWEKMFVVRNLKNRNAHLRNYALITLIRLGDFSRADQLIKKMVHLARSKNKRELEFILSKYRLFSEKKRDSFIQKMQQLKVVDVKLLLESFTTSKFVFTKEIRELDL